MKKKKKGTSLLSVLLRLFRDPVTLLKCSLIVERNSHWTEWLVIYYLSQEPVKIEVWKRHRITQEALWLPRHNL